MTLPTIHMNGTGVASLIADNDRTVELLRDTMNAMVLTAPNGRDYYPQAPGAFAEAQAEYEARYARLRLVLRDLEAMQEYLYGQQELRTR